jgi:hypothetical protein
MSLPNTALVLIKPHAATAEVDALLLRRLAEWHITVTERGETRVTAAVIDAHYGVIANGAWMAPTALAVGAKGRENFVEKNGVDWDSASRRGDVISARSALKALHGDIDALARLWTAAAATSVRLAGGMYVRRIESLHGALVVNGFYPAMRRSFVGKSLRWLVVQWDARALPWSRFRAEVFGPTNASAAPRTTLRRYCIDEWRALGMARRPTDGENCFHASAGPLEGLHERRTWLGRALRDDAFGRQLWAACRGGAAATASTPEPMGAWLRNEVTTIEGVTDSAFELLEERDSAAVLALAAERARATTLATPSRL